MDVAPEEARRKQLDRARKSLEQINLGVHSFGPPSGNIAIEMQVLRHPESADGWQIRTFTVGSPVARLLVVAPDGNPKDYTGCCYENAYSAGDALKASLAKTATPMNISPLAKQKILRLMLAGLRRGKIKSGGTFLVRFPNLETLET